MTLESNDGQYYEMLAKKVREQTLTGKAPWLNPMKAGEKTISHNPTNGMVYNGINSVMMDMIAAEKGYTDSRWITTADTERFSDKISVRYGEKPSLVVYQNKFQHPTDINPMTGKPVGEQDGIKYYRVYNAEQIKGMPEQKIEMTARQRERAENIEKNTGMSVRKAIDCLGEKNFTSSECPKTASAIAQYHYAKEMGIDYTPSVSYKDCYQELKDKSQMDIIKSLYRGEVEKDRIMQPQRNLENDRTRTIQVDKQRQMPGVER